MKWMACGRNMSECELKPMGLCECWRPPIRVYLVRTLLHVADKLLTLALRLAPEMGRGK